MVINWFTALNLWVQHSLVPDMLLSSRETFGWFFSCTELKQQSSDESHNVLCFSSLHHNTWVSVFMILKLCPCINSQQLLMPSCQENPNISKTSLQVNTNLAIFRSIDEKCYIQLLFTVSECESVPIPCWNTVIWMLFKPHAIYDLDI